MTTNLFKAFVACAALAVGSIYASAAKVLVVAGAGGEETVFAFSDAPKVTVGASDLTVAAGSTLLEFPIGQVVKFAVEDRELNSAVSAELGGEVYRLNGDALSASGLKPGSAVVAYSIDGRELASAVADSQGYVQLDLSAAKGVVIVKTATKVFKIKK